MRGLYKIHIQCLKTNMYCIVKYKMLILIQYLAKSRKYSNLELIFLCLNFNISLTYYYNCKSKLLRSMSKVNCSISGVRLHDYQDNVILECLTIEQNKKQYRPS